MHMEDAVAGLGNKLCGVNKLVDEMAGVKVDAERGMMGDLMVE